MRLGAILGVLISCLVWAAAGDAPGSAWQPVVEDEFERQMIGPDWRILRGDWRIEDGRLRVTRAWPSDNNIVCTRPMPRGDMRAVVKLQLEANNSISLALRAGEHFWGGGGFPDHFAVHLRGTPDLAAAELVEGVLRVPADRDCTVAMSIVGGRAMLQVEGKTVVEAAAAAARSEFNRSFYLNCMPNGWVDSIKLYTRPGLTLALPVAANSPLENMQATVRAAKYIDPRNPAPGMQAAIDSLPPTGGVVILPAGEFIMRRHLALPAGVTLRGQGCDKTILRAFPFHDSDIVKLEPKGDHCLVTVADASAFHVGDGVCYGRSWGHNAGQHPDGPNRNHVVTAINGNVVSVSGGEPPKARSGQPAYLNHFFPLIYSVAQEFVGVQDLTLDWTRPPAKEPEIDPKTGRAKRPKPGRANGGFMTCPITFGTIAGARITRINVLGYPSDGISVQGAGDAIVTDCTVTASGNGFHPGTRTQRWLSARNRALGNATGLFFCFSNENGIYYQSSLDSIGGYPGVGDVFNALVGNELVKTVGIGSGGYAGLFCNNRMPGLFTSRVPSEPGWPIYFSAPHYYVLAENQLGELKLGEGTKAVVVAGNRPLEPGAEIAFDGDFGSNLHAKNVSGLAPKLGLTAGVGRTTPVAAPVLPTPIIDGRRYYNERLPDCGFQRALDKLAKVGGTLQLPGGRYPLGAPLRLPAGVTLAGHGVGTVLYAAAGYRGSLIVSQKTSKIGIRELTVLSAYDPALERAPAIALADCREARLDSIDVRGWEGDAIVVAGSAITIQDCRVFGAAGDGFRVAGPDIGINSSLARSCRRGFVLQNAARARIEASIASGNQASGIAIAGGAAPLVYANSSSYNGGDGMVLTEVDGGHVLGNLCRANNQGLKGAAGIRLGQGAAGLAVVYNHCSDDQIHATQAQGIVEEKVARGNTIRYNLACPFYMNHQLRRQPAIVAAGDDSTVADNLVRSAVPSGSSIESMRLGFSKTPHWHNMQRNRRRQRLDGAQKKLKYLETRQKLVLRQHADLAKQIAAQKKLGDAGAGALKKSMLALQRNERGQQQNENQRRLAQLELRHVQQEIKTAEQEVEIRRRKYAVMVLQQQETPDPAAVAKAEATVQDAKREMAARQKVFEDLTRQLAELKPAK